MLTRFKNKIINFSHFVGNSCFLNRLNLNQVKYKKLIYFYTLSWGRYTNIFFKYGLPSILDKTNLSSLMDEGYEVKFFFYTLEDNISELEEYKENENYKYIKENIKTVQHSQDISIRELAANALKDFLSICIEDKAVMFMAPPDTVFSSSSISNVVKSSYGTKKCFASAFPRVSPDILENLTLRSDYSPTSLVRLAFKYPHTSLEFADECKEFNLCSSGMSYRKIDKNLYSVTHTLPTPFLVYPIIEDLKLFEKYNDFNMWDRDWLSFLVKTNRVKVSGSSDLFFCIELTFIDNNSTPELNKDKYYFSKSNVFHHRVCGSFSSVWRSK